MTVIDERSGEKILSGLVIDAVSQAVTKPDLALTIDRNLIGSDALMTPITRFVGRTTGKKLEKCGNAYVKEGIMARYRRLCHP